MISQTWVDMLENSYFIFVYGITWIIAMATYNKYYNTILKYFPLLIAYTFLNELLGILIRYTDYFSFFSQKEYANANDIVYNIYDILFFGFFYFVYWKLLKSQKNRNWVLLGSGTALLSYIISAFLQNPLKVSLYYANAVSCWVLLSFIMIYLNQLRVDWNWKIQRGNLMFWISLGLAIFHLFFPFLFTTAYLNYEISQSYHLQSILRILIVIMYTIFCIGFIVSRKNTVK